MKEYRRKEEEGVSPVIATILMVAITVVLAATLYLMLPKSTTGSATVSIQFVGHKLAANKWSLDVAANSINPTDLKYALISSDGTAIVSGEPFPTTPNTPTNTTTTTTNIQVTWNDLNGDGKVNTGDSIVIYDSGATPTLSSGDIFRIVSGATGEITLT